MLGCVLEKTGSCRFLSPTWWFAMRIENEVLLIGYRLDAGGKLDLF